MSKFGTVLKIGSTILAAAGGVAAVGEVVVDKVQQSGQTVVVEEYNYEYQHVINTTDTWIINGEEVDQDTWNSAKGTNDSKSSDILDESPITFYYGTTTSNPKYLTISSLNAVNDTSTSKSYTEFISTTNDGGEYIVFVVPSTYKVEIECGIRFTVGNGLTSVKYSDSLTIYYLNAPVCDDEGTTYKLILSK